jgi:predicted phage-related endonuclease
MALLGKAELGSVNGEIAASWKAVETSRLDQKRLKEERPEVVEAYSSVSLSRRFSLVNEGKEI